MGHPTPAQKIVRRAFKDSCNCFNIQPDAGGATPPAIGPRSKPWWHNDSLTSGLRYFTYFMHKTLPVFLAGSVPDWCQTALEDSAVDSGLPNQNQGDKDVTWTQDWFDGPAAVQAYAFIKTPSDFANKILNIRCENIFTRGLEEAEGPIREIECYSVDASLWEEMAITWNNKPAVGALLDSKLVMNEGWVTYAIGAASSVCLKLELIAGENWKDWETLYEFTSGEEGENFPYITEA